MSGCKLSPVGLGLSFGILWGLSLFIFGLLAYAYAYGVPFVHAVGAVYVGYVPTIPGSIVGGLIGFVEAFILGFLIAWLYNRFNGCGCRCCEKEPEVVEIREVKPVKTVRAKKAKA